jgi:hypothetical protein
MMEDASGGWGKLGLSRDPVPGDLRVLQQVIDDCQYLRDTAWSVSYGLDVFLAAASAGGFEGATADALRGAISGRLKTFIQNIGRAFSLAGEAVAEYRLALVQAQQSVSGLMAQAQGPAAKDPELTGVKQRVSDQIARVRDAEAVMIRALEDASAMVSQPIKMPSLSEKIWNGTEKALWITAIVLGALSTIVDGPLGIAATAAGTASFAMTLTDYARGKTKLPDVLLSLTGLLFPATKGFFTLEQVGRGLRGFVGALGQAEGKAAQMLASPSALAAFAARGLARTSQGLVWTGQGLARVPGLLVDGVRALPGAVASLPQMLKGLGEAVGQDFATVQKRYPKLGRVLTPAGVYTVVTFGRGLGALFTPMTIQDLTRWGFRGAWRVGWARASWRNAARAFSAGWASKGLRAAHPAMDIGHTVEYWHRFVPKPVIAEEASAAGLVVPGPVLWADRGPGGLGEPMLPPVDTWTTRDLEHTGFLDGMRPAPHQDAYVLTAGEQITALDMLSAPAAPRLDQRTFQPGERPFGNGVAGRSVELEDVPVAPPEVLSVHETLELLRGRALAGDHITVPAGTGELVNHHPPWSTLPRPEATQAPLRDLETSGGGAGYAPLGDVTAAERSAERSAETHTAAEGLRGQDITSGIPRSQVRMMLHRHGALPSENVTLPPVRIEMVREGQVEPAGALRSALRLDGVQVLQVRIVHLDGQPPYLELVDAPGTLLADPVDQADAAAAEHEFLLREDQDPITPTLAVGGSRDFGSALPQTDDAGHAAAEVNQHLGMWPTPSVPEARSHVLLRPDRFAPADPADLELVAFQREATRFERRLGVYLVQHPRVVEEVAKFARIAWERIPREERHMFGVEDPKLTGAVGCDYQALQEVALEGNIREQSLFLRTGMRQKGIWGLFAQYTGRPCEVPSELSAALVGWEDCHPVVLEPAIATFREILPPSRREAVFSDNGAMWQSGEQKKTMAFLPSSASGERLPFDARTFREGPHLTAERTGGLVAAGISGTTWRMLHYAEVANAVWEAGLDLPWFRLAVIGGQLACGHHTLHEVLTTADMWAREEGYSHIRAHLGFEYHDNWGRYRHLAPLTERELREHVALGGLFPDELVRGPDLPAYDPVDDPRQALAENLSAPHGAAAPPAPEVVGSLHIPLTGGEFTVTPVGGGAEYNVVHEPTGLRTRFAGEAHEVVYHEVNPGFGPSELRKLKVAAHYVRQDDGRIARSYELLDPFTSCPFIGRFTVKPAPQDLHDSRQAAFSVRDEESGLRLHYLADGRPVARDQQLAKGLGYLRFDMFRPTADPQWLDPEGRPTALFRVAPLGGERVALIAARPVAGPLEGFVVDSESGRVLQETLATPEGGMTLPDGSCVADDGQGAARRPSVHIPNGELTVADSATVHSSVGSAGEDSAEHIARTGLSLLSGTGPSVESLHEDPDLR